MTMEFYKDKINGMKDSNKNEVNGMEDKYRMTVEQNVFVAKRNIVDYIWKSANLEGIAVTYPDTEAIFNGLSVPNMKVDDIVAINNLKHAWKFILDNIDYPMDYSFICHINRLVGGDNLIFNAGFIRNLPVRIGGTSWTPDIPIEAQIKDDIKAILEIESPTDRGITLTLYCMRKQMFLDGNKRTSMLAGNHVLIGSGAGIISIPIEMQREFTMLMVKFYESNDMTEIKRFIYDKGIDGIPFENNKANENKDSTKEIKGKKDR